MDFPTRFTTTVNSAYTSGGTSLVLASVTGLPTGSCLFWLIVQAEGANTEEVFKVTNVNAGTKTLTVVGAQDNTSASNHALGAVVLAGIITQEVLQSFVVGGGGGVLQGTRAARPAANTVSAGTLYQCNNGPYYFISDGTNWTAYVGGVPVTEPQLADFTQVNFTNFSADDSRGGIYVQDTLAFGIGLSNSNALLIQASPAPPYTVSVGFWFTSISSNGFSGGGLCLYDSGSTKVVTLYKQNNSNVSDNILTWEKWNSPTSFNSGYSTRGLAASNPGSPITYLRSQDSGGNRTPFYSTNPFNFQQSNGSVSNTDFLTPNNVGMAVNMTDGIFNVGVWFLHFQVTTP